MNVTKSLKYGPERIVPPRLLSVNMGKTRETNVKINPLVEERRMALHSHGKMWFVRFVLCATGLSVHNGC